MIQGFTGTRAGMTAAQKDGVTRYIICETDGLPSIAMHGGAPGSDEQFDEIVTGILIGIRVAIRPCAMDRYCFWIAKGDAVVRSIYAPIAPLVRNKIIVNESDCMIATPAEAQEQQRGGTWSTIRYTRKVGKPLVVIFPDGTVIRERMPRRTTQERKVLARILQK
jgi:hypothetical protein